MRHRSASALVVGLVFCIAIGIASIAHAQEAAPSAATTATAPYELDFTLPSESRSGCVVCHGDPALGRVRGGAIVSFFIEEDVVLSSTHAEQQCVACHVDFTYRSPHTTEGWQVTAKSACRNCHDEQSRAVGLGAHRPSVDSTATTPVVESAETSPAPKPLCGDCHGSHDMAALTAKGGEGWEEGQVSIKKQGWQICGRCHEDYWNNYDDYYHGAAYKLGAEDAPACWDCHGWHDILPSKDRASRVNEAHLVETCGQEGCHSGVDENYTEYAAFIHGREKVTADNWLHSVLRSISGAFGRLFGGAEA